MITDTQSTPNAEVDPHAPRVDLPIAPSWTAPVAGFVSGLTAIGVGLLVAGIADVDSPLNSIGSEFIDRTPKWLKDLAIDWFGTNDKQALRVGMVITIALLSLVVGAVGRKRPAFAVAVLGAFGVFGAFVAAGRPGQSIRAGVPALLGAVVGCWLLWTLLASIRSSDPAARPGLFRRPGPWDRRRFIATTGGAAAVAALAALSARRLESERVETLADDAPDELPPVVGTPGADTPVIPASATLYPDTPFITPNDDFYLIDTALSLPRINLANWRVDITGMVDNPFSLSYDDLLALPQVERVVTIACVSNEVGGNLIGTAVWQGVMLADVLERAGVQPGAEQVFGTSVDGWTCGFPVEAAFDGRDAMIAVGMNGEPLPLQHGFPARVIIPGLYGYVSATKWLRELKLTTWADDVGYWVPRGWSRDAPIKTQSRIDVPRRGQNIPAGRTPIAGVAWAQQRGVSKVEVRIDGGEWNEARLGTDVSVDTWRQWLYEWDATPGQHTVQVRATDGNGDTQVEDISRPDPDGATGWHTRTLQVG